MAKVIEDTHQGEFDLTWNLVFDLPEDHKFQEETLATLNKYKFIQWKCWQQERWHGMPQVNHALDITPPDAWVWTTADDNLPHPLMFKRLRRLIDEYPDKQAFVWGQYRHGGATLEAAPGNMHPCHVDGGQYVIRKSLYGDYRFNYSRVCDGETAEYMYKKYPDAFHFVPEILSFFEGDMKDYENALEKIKAEPPKYGLVIATVFYGEPFFSAVNSLMRSGFNGAIAVAEDGFIKDEHLKEYCAERGFKYGKMPKWCCDQNIDMGVRLLPVDTDIVIYCHNDVEFHDSWFDQLKSAWGELYHTRKVGMINMAYSDGLLERPDIRFGLSNDIQKPGRLGRTSPVTSFLYTLWQQITPLEMGVAFDVELQYLMARRRMWSVWCRSEPPIHHRFDPDRDEISIRNYGGNDGFNAMVMNTYQKWREKYGCELEDYLNADFAEGKVIHHQEILNALATKDFDRIDFVFDVIRTKLEEKCRSRGLKLSW